MHFRNSKRRGHTSLPLHVIFSPPGRASLPLLRSMPACDSHLYTPLLGTKGGEEWQAVVLLGGSRFRRAGGKGREKRREKTRQVGVGRPVLNTDTKTIHICCTTQACQVMHSVGGPSYAGWGEGGRCRSGWIHRGWGRQMWLTASKVPFQTASPQRSHA